MSLSCIEIKDEVETESNRIKLDSRTSCNDGTLAGDDTSVNGNDNIITQLETNLPAQKSNGSNDLSTPEIVSLNKKGAELPVLSKSALKRKMKKDLWELRKKEKRIKEREKRKKRKLDPTHCLNTVTRKQLKSATMANSSCKVNIAIDLSFDNYMDERSIAKCIKQISRCYSINRRATNPVQFHVTSLDGDSLLEMRKNSGYENWDVNLHDKHFTDIFSKQKIVYLTSESDNIIDTLNDDLVYIIGGLVDHNSHKGLCHKLAEEKGLCHGRLPIGENIDMKTRKVLTIDHVFNIIVNVSNGQSWKAALLEILPARKGAQEKPGEGEKIVAGEEATDEDAVASEDIVANAVDDKVIVADENVMVDEDAITDGNSKFELSEAKLTSSSF